MWIACYISNKQLRYDCWQEANKSIWFYWLLVLLWATPSWTRKAARICFHQCLHWTFLEPQASFQFRKNFRRNRCPKTPLKFLSISSLNFNNKSPRWISMEQSLLFTTLPFLSSVLPTKTFWQNVSLENNHKTQYPRVDTNLILSG